MTAFFLNKSPKAAQAREKARKLTAEGQSQETADMEPNKITRGPKAPFWGTRGGSTDHPTADTRAQQPSVALVGRAEARGRPAKKDSGQKKRTQWALGKLATSNKDREEESTKEGHRKQKKGRDTPQRKGIRDIRSFFEAKEGPSGPFLGKDKKEGK